ncbi:subtype I-E CRISPR-associated endonuclease Cas1, partial [Escherichia coli]|nr:subtype I-E CRISPR-associated endonuclease Cas1 [Escherichia coli]
AEPDKEVRLACRDIFRGTKLTGKLIPLIEEVLAAGEIEPPQPAPDMLPPAIPEPETLGDSGHWGAADEHGRGCYRKCPSALTWTARNLATGSACRCVCW